VSRELYVYYRVQQAHWREAAQTVMAWQRHLRAAHPNLGARLLRRPDAHDDCVTLMETYTGALAGDAALQAEIAHGAPALQPSLIGERHVEHFDALD
jgi:hypothetical protein